MPNEAEKVTLGRFAKVSRFRVQRPLVRGSVQDSHLRQGRGMSLPSEAVEEAFSCLRQAEEERGREAQRGRESHTGD